MLKQVILGLCCLFLLCACGNENPDNYHMPDLEQSCLYLGESETMVYPYDGYIYSVGENLKRLDPVSGSTEMLVKLTAEVKTFSVGEEGICILYPEQVGLYTWNGDERDKLSLEGMENIINTEICETEKYVWIAYGIPGASEKDVYENYSSVSLIHKETGEVRKLTSDVQTLRVLQMIPGGGETAFFLASNGVFRCTPHKIEQHMSILQEMNCGCYVLATDNVYASLFSSNTVISLEMIYQDGVESLRQISMETYAAQAGRVSGKVDGNYYIGKIWYTGKDIILWDTYHHTVTIYDDYRLQKDSLRILYPKFQSADQNYTDIGWGSVEEDMNRFEEQYDIAVKGTGYPADQFQDRLRMKLLAGDSDYDVVYMEKAEQSELFASILQYELFLPLENDPEFMACWLEMLEGVQDALTWNGHLYGVPLKIKGKGLYITESYISAGLPEIPSDWNLDTLWEICAAAEKVCDSVTALMPCPTDAIVRSVLESSVPEGKIDEEILATHLGKMYYWLEKGVLGWHGTGKTFLLKSIYGPGDGLNDPRETSGYVVNTPGYTGQNYVTVSNFLFANRNTEQPEMAIEYLTMLMEPEEIYALRCYMGKDASAYYWMTDDAVSRLDYHKQRQSVCITDGGKYIMEEAVPVLLQGSVPYLLPYAAMDDYIFEHLDTPLKEGNFPLVADITAKICKEARYRYLE